MTLEVCNDHGDSRSPPAKQAKKVDFEDILRRSHSEDYDHDSASEVLDPSQSNSGTAAMERKPGDRIVNDCIHGTICLPKAAWLIIDTPQFQRLRNIKQTGTCHLVYPNANHTRFQHSIGVAFLAQKFAEHLLANYPELVDKKDVICVTLAGLCHDLGHGPYSHLWERFISEAVPDCKYDHETTSIRMLDRLLDQNQLRPFLKSSAGIDDQDIMFIKELIVGPLDPTSGFPSRTLSANDEKWPYVGRSEKKSFLYEIVANKISGIDVDKWDYFLRDDYYLKVGHIFDYRRFILFSRVEKTGFPSRRRIIIREKEAENLKEMYRDRTRLHIHGYQHRITKVADRMLLDAWRMADPYLTIRGYDGTRMRPSEASLTDMSAHECLTDEYLEFKIMESEDPSILPAKTLLQRMKRRDLYVVIMSIDAQQLGNCSKTEVLEDIQNFMDQHPVEGFYPKHDLCLVGKKISLGLKRFQVYFYRKGSEEISSCSHDALLDGVEHNEIVIMCKERSKTTVALEALQMWSANRGLGPRP